MKNEQVRQKSKTRLIPLIVFGVTLLALALTNVVQAAPLAQQPPTYGMTLTPQDVQLCVGQKQIFTVTVPLTVTDRTTGAPAPIYYSGERVIVTGFDSHIVDVPVTSLYTSPYPGGERHSRRFARFQIVSSPKTLTFEFTALKKGVTTIEFKHFTSVKPFHPALSLSAQVEVKDCWEAYATGLWTGNTGNNWTKKDICSLERPFVLEGSGAGVGGLATANFKSRAFFFWPFSNPFAVAGLAALQDGRYIMVGGNEITAFGKTVRCTLVGSGSYQQFLFENRTPKEGNFILNGSSDLYCEGYNTHTDREAIEVAFRALGAGQACQESLPGLNP